jgi:hypothetical protein
MAMQITKEQRKELNEISKRELVAYKILAWSSFIGFMIYVLIVENRK